jgi:hypothetical protein
MIRYLASCCIALAVPFCGCESGRGSPAAPTPPSGPSRPGPQPPPSFGAVRVEGRVIGSGRLWIV